MKLEDLLFQYPDDLVATQRSAISKILWSAGETLEEINKPTLLERIKPGDAFIINDTKVSPRRVIISPDFDVLFLRPVGAKKWQALSQLRKLEGKEFELPGGVKVELVQKGRPHVVQLSRELNEEYFEKYGEPPLPPYIYRARKESLARSEDRKWYQTAWAKRVGSVAAPTASFHFDLMDLDFLRDRGVLIGSVTLHVGAGTFLPVTVDDLKDHVMHKEQVFVPDSTLSMISRARESGGRVWVLGTTTVRALESAALGILHKVQDGFEGETDLLIQDDFRFRMVDVLLTNFHQPQSTLLALVCAFAGRDRVLRAYDWAIERRFKLFSYGDLTVWSQGPSL